MSKLRDILLGPALPDAAAHQEKLPILIGLGVICSDVISSCAYATDEMLAVLVLAGSTALFWSVPICIVIIGLLTVLVISYRQLIRAYPSGGGAYTVARENLGKPAGLIAASGLMIDYVLTASVSIAAGVDAIVSAFPVLLPAKVEIGVIFLAIMLIGNLRGVRESGRVFAVPTLAFVIILTVLIVVGLTKDLMGNVAVVAPQIPSENITESMGLFLLLRAFSSGCSALTGTEAISNAVAVFKKPEVENARKTMLFMGIILGVLFFGVTFLARAFGIVPVVGQTVISQIAHLVFGNSPLYYIVQFATLFILVMAANTSFAGFPRVTSMLGRDGYLPSWLSDVGSRLVFSNGIILLAVLAGALFVGFRGDVGALIPLYAVGVFISFTLSQTGMVRHWLRVKQHGWRRSAAINAFGAFLTALALIVIIATKFTHGAWSVLLLIPICFYGFSRIHKHYEELATKLTMQLQKTLPIDSVTYRNRIVALVPDRAKDIPWVIQYARTLARDVRYVYIDRQDPEKLLEIKQGWAAAAPSIPLEVITAVLDDAPAVITRYLREMNDEDIALTVVMPEHVITGGRWSRFRENRRNVLLKRALFRERIPVVSVVLNGETAISRPPVEAGGTAPAPKHTLVMLVSGVRRGLTQTIQHISSISPDVKAIYVDCEGPEKAKEIERQWAVYLPFMPLLILPSLYRDLVKPVQEYIGTFKKVPNTLVTVVIPELVKGTAISHFLHRNAAAKLKNVLLYQEHIPVLSYSYRVPKRRIRVVRTYHPARQ